MLAVAALAIAGGLGWYWYSIRSGDAAQAARDAAVEAPLPDATPAFPPLTDLPAVDVSDALVRELAAALSSHPRVAAWLATDDLVRRYVVTVSALAHGVSPRQQLPFMVPGHSVVVRSVSGRMFMDPASYGRYDALTAAFVSLDPQGVARLHGQLRPLIDRAWAELGLSRVGYDEALARAFGRLLAVQVPRGPVEVLPSAAAYAFVDPDLETLAPAEKHLARTGPDNARRIQEKLRELADAMGVEPRTP